MQRAARASLVAALHLSSLAACAEVTPVQKVIQLMTGMREKGKAEKHAEQVQFAAYKQFCDDTTVEKQRAIKEATAKMEQLVAAIQKAEADAATLAKEIAQLDEDISVYEGDKKAATEVREMENADYLTTHKDYSESVDALERAIATLKKQAYDRTQLLQVNKLELIPEHAKKVISAFLSQGDEMEEDPLAVSAPQANAYEFQSSGIVDMLEKLKDKSWISISYAWRALLSSFSRSVRSSSNLSFSFSSMSTMPEDWNS